MSPHHIVTFDPKVKWPKILVLVAWSAEFQMATWVIVLIAGLLVVTSPDASKADLSACASRIQTVENLLSRLSEETNGETYRSLTLRQFRRIDVAAARTHVSEAKAYMTEGLDMECQFHAIAAMRALGYLL